MLTRIVTLALATTLTVTPALAISPLRSAVISLYAASDKVFSAIDRDTCTDDGSAEDRTGRRGLSRDQARSYDRIVRKLDVAYQKAAPEDMPLPQVRKVLTQLRLDFCDAVANPLS